MRYLVLVVIVLLPLGCADRGATDGASPQTVVGANHEGNESRFVFTAPAGFEWNVQHRIWYNKKTRTSVSLAHAPGTSFQTVVDDFVADRMLASSLELLNKEVRDIDGRPTLSVHANRLNAKYPQKSFTVAFGTITGCAQITAIYPADMNKDMKTQIESALLNSRYEMPD